MDIFMDLISTQSLTVGIFMLLLIILLAAVGITVILLAVWDKFHQRKQKKQRERQKHQGEMAEWYESYAEPEQDAKARMDTLLRPVEAPQGHWIDKLLTKYLLSLEVDPDAGVVRLTDRKFFELKNKVVELPVARILGLDEPTAKDLCSRVRSILNRRAQRQGIIPIKHRLGVETA